MTEGKQSLFPFLRKAGWRVHGWAYPIVWWARRKPHSSFRQWLWGVSDGIQWRRAMRHWGKLRAMTRPELEAYVARKYGRRGN